MRKLIIALALLATISPAFAGRLSEAAGATAGRDANISANANMSGSVGTAAGATVGVL
ncbi:MAG TPA: hypothetical protein VKB42_22625 [Dongiaceae bacterium]|nr:hypothetical protein [Dongiaceae bacterium]